MQRLTFFLILSGMLWLAVGFFLMSKGLGYLMISLRIPVVQGFSLINWTTSLFGSRETSALWLIILSMLIGWMKGRMVLAKTARKTAERLRSLARPIKISDAYPLKYLFLIAGMILLGISLKLLKTPSEVMGVVDIAVGTALVQGAIAYFRQTQGETQNAKRKMQNEKEQD